ncbi:FAD-binding oxidoreductase [Ralstonia mojiangensis]|uniref:FAD-binding oxidoreductase n=1 Tax=Ralstonia mojiangensis TaxID=2953895 RepID=UPI0021B3C751|nr:FAD-binding oxidoreductase [Ralstonia mojiangensis]MCT7325038.1 FAD-binding oxidoreductase [Ralstonia mojiangensis]
MSYTIRIEPAGVEIACERNQTLLDAALGQGYLLHHSCRRGECGSCWVDVVSGQVDAAGRPPGESAHRGCLTCQTRPRSDVVIHAPEVSAVPGRRVVQVSARVLEVERLCGDVSMVRLQMPPSAGFQFTPGQYMDVILRDGTRRSYSLASAPNNEGVIEWHVRSIPGGRFSPHVYNLLKPRDLLRVEGPFGNFVLSESTAPVILLASGTGFAPIASMLRSQTDALRRRGVALYWGGRAEKDLYAMEEAERWADQNAGCTFVPVLWGDEAGWRGRRGFVQDAVIEDIPDLSSREVYACGSPIMVDAARDLYCRDHGLKAERFFSDAFFRERTIS